MHWTSRSKMKVSAFLTLVNCYRTLSCFKIDTGPKVKQSNDSLIFIKIGLFPRWTAAIHGGKNIYIRWFTKTTL